MDLTVKTAPSTFSIDKGLVKANKRILHASEDSLIEFWIGVADAYVEKRTNRALMLQTLVLRLRRVIPTVYLPRPTLASITSVKITPSGGSETSLDVNVDVQRRNDDMLTVIDIPAVSAFGVAGTMEVEYVAGAGNAANVPAPLRQASLLMASHYVTSREAAWMDPRLMQVEKKIVFGVDELIKEYRVPNLNEQPNEAWA